MFLHKVIERVTMVPEFGIDEAHEHVGIHLAVVRKVHAREDGRGACDRQGAGFRGRSGYAGDVSALSKLGEARIDEAIASGELQPPPPGTELDLESYFNTPEGWRAALSMLKAHGFLPPEMELLKKAAELEEELAGCGDAQTRVKLRRRIDELQTGFRLARERMEQG